MAKRFARSMRPAAIARRPHARALGRGPRTRRAERPLLSRARARRGAPSRSSSTGGNGGVRSEIALLNTSRLLFLSFLEAKGWLDGDRRVSQHHCSSSACTGAWRFSQSRSSTALLRNAQHALAPSIARGERLWPNPIPQRRTVRANPRSSERIAASTFSDDAYGAADLRSCSASTGSRRAKKAPTWSEAAVDPEMLGRAFESLMAAPDRGRTGAFFTPFALVDRLTRTGLETVLGAHGASRSMPPRCRRARRTELASALRRAHRSRSGLRVGRVSRSRARAARVVRTQRSATTAT